MTVQTLSSEVQRVHNRVISCATIRRRVLASELQSRRPQRVPFLTVRQRTVCSGLELIKIGIGEWRNVLFTGESRFELVSDDYRSRVWKKAGCRNRPERDILVAHFRDGAEMFWESIMFGRRTPLIHMPGIMTCAY